MALQHVFKIYVPSTVDVARPVDNSDAVNHCLSYLSGLFGGATCQECRGAWLSNNGSLVTEKITVCYSFTNLRGFLRGRRAVLDFAKKLRDDMKQEAVSVEINGRLYFI